MGALLSLPDELVASLLYSWLEVEDVGRLDAAVCNHGLRQLFMKTAFSNRYAVIQYEFFPTNEVKYRTLLDISTRWALKRGVAMRNLTITDELVRACGDGRWLAYAKGDEVHEIRVDVRQTEVDPLLRLLCQTCPNVSIARCPTFADKTFAQLMAKSWPNLTSLTVGAINGADLLSLGKSCKSLISLTITWGQVGVTMDQWEEFFQNCSPDFECIRARVHFTAAVLSAIAHHCPRMLEIDVYPGHYDDGILTELSQGCLLLQRVELFGSSERVSDIGLTALSRAGNLMALLIGDCTGISDEGVQIAAKNCPGLTEIDVSDCFLLCDRILIAIGQHCHQLRLLRLGGLAVADPDNTDVMGFKAIVQGCPLLRELYGECCGALAMALPVLAQGLPNLVVFHAGEMDFPVEDLLIFAQSHPSLRELIVGGPQVGSSVIESIRMACPKLEVLEVGEEVV